MKSWFIMIRNSLRNLLLNKKLSLIVVNIVLFLFVAGIMFIPKSFAVPINSLEITSNNTSYENNESGAWRILTNAKWISKGVAEITFDVDTIIKQKSKNTDLLLVLDMSESMIGDRLTKVKAATIELVNSVLSNSNNNVGVITFGTTSSIVNTFTNDKNTLVTKIDSLAGSGQRNYYQALINVDQVLKSYDEDKNRDCVVLFLTDGSSNVEIPNEAFEYQYLKEQYPFIRVNAVQYEMGDSINSSVKNISDEQFSSKGDSLNKTLFSASNISESYSEFEMSYYLDDKNFYIEDIKNIIASNGNVNFDSINQKITWKMDGLRTGTNEKMTLKVNLNSEYFGREGEFFLSREIDIQSKLLENIENVSNQSALILGSSYKVKYDTNLPRGCSVFGSIPEDEFHSSLDIIKLSNSSLRCGNYQFRGWEIITKDVNKVNDEYFIMPESDVMLRAIWGKASVTKSIDGMEAKERTITYNLGGGTVSGNPTSFYDNQANFVLKRPTRSGYTFAGWTGTDLSEATYNVTVDTSKKKNYTFTAKWIKNETPNYLDLPRTKNNCTLSDIYIDVEVGNCLTVFLNISGSPTKVEAPTWGTDDQSDIDWSELTSGSWTREGRKFNYAHTYANKSAIKSYFTHVYLTCGGVRDYYVGYNYTLASSTFTLNYNNGTSDKMTSGKYNLGSDVSLSSVTKPTKSGYTFIGWSTKASNPSDIISSFRIANSGQILYGTFVKTNNK